MNNTFQVQGMTCGHCEMAVKKAINRLDPEAKVVIDRPAGKVDVESSKAREEIAHVIAEEGYTVAA
ncbi:MAG: copper chaperone [Betaproteobacteria bacterium]|jgi:copper chaperone|uniref:heavy-metal-associated domain-containing protein n=1 Tax=Limnohabitans sp. 103DPR2 TaxID=1678129 RepID=UPI0006DCD268|nr:cation transporter [Limnohabitans sp. 103DPR2]MDE3233653.1 heavy-metal-associated domain-containing protein [Pseudomonadota bacterium]NBQ07531.1 copper chaperone [Betaproteobacteria bacterium]ALK91438.1 Copper chaperone CopZ [Limnohabitans sp. 103DPR2]NBZ99035.1 copper chaperone [Betaproteobacteria bacterium]NDB43957.1 copper chaperone [Betaproteobacteria bacterium]